MIDMNHLPYPKNKKNKMEQSDVCSMHYVSECQNHMDTKYVIHVTNHNGKDFDKYFCGQVCMDRFNMRDMCGMIYHSNCPHKSNDKYKEKTNSYYRNKSNYPTFFCSEECADTYRKYHMCQGCSYTGSLQISKVNNLAYCTSYPCDYSCYERHTGISRIIEEIAKIMLPDPNEKNEDIFDLDDLKLIKERINEILDEKIREKENEKEND
jgi:hypothetical protein